MLDIPMMPFTTGMIAHGHDYLSGAQDYRAVAKDTPNELISAPESSRSGRQVQFSCSICHKLAASKAELQYVLFYRGRELRADTNVCSSHYEACHKRTHHCPAVKCCWSFAQAKDLKRHSTSHDESGKVPCPYTNCTYHLRGFKRKDNLRRHSTRRHNDGEHN